MFQFDCVKQASWEAGKLCVPDGMYCGCTCGVCHHLNLRGEKRGGEVEGKGGKVRGRRREGRGGGGEEMGGEEGEGGR